MFERLKDFIYGISNRTKFIVLIVQSLFITVTCIVAPLIYLVVTCAKANKPGFLSKTNPFTGVWYSAFVIVIAMLLLLDCWSDILLQRIFDSWHSQRHFQSNILFVLIRVLIAIALSLYSIPVWISYITLVKTEYAGGWWSIMLLLLAVLFVEIALFKMAIIKTTKGKKRATAKFESVLGDDTEYNEDIEEDDEDQSEQQQHVGEYSPMDRLSRKVNKKERKWCRFSPYCCLNYGFKSLFTFCLLFVAILLTLSLIHALKMGIEIKSIKRPGRLIGVAGNKYYLHLHCTGPSSSDRPTIVIDSGLGVSSPVAYWQFIQSSLSNTTRVCVYERAGYGWSDSGRHPRTSEQITSELYQLLNKSREKSPFILVGHSFAGYNIRLFATKYPQLTSGLLFVDSSHENQQREFWKAQGISESTGMKMLKRQSASLNMLRVMSPLALFRVSVRMDPSSVVPFEQNEYFTSDQKRTYKIATLRNKYTDVLWSESSNLLKSASQVNATRSTEGFGNLPITVLTAGAPINGTCAENHMSNQSQMCKEHKKYLKENAQVILREQEDLASLSTDSKWSIVWGSSHNIALDRPHVIIQEIEELVNRVV